MKKLKRGGILLLVVALMAFAVPMLVACNGEEAFADTLSHYQMDIIFCDESKSIDVVLTLDYRNNYAVELTELHFNVPPAAFREGAKFRPVAASEMERAFPNGESFGGIAFESVTLNGAVANHSIAGDDANVLVIPFVNPLLPQRRASIEMRFTVTIPNMRHRLGWYNHLVNLGNFFPIAAVFQNGAFATSNYYYIGDPFFSAVANFCVSITKPTRLTAAMSGATERVDAGEGKTTTSGSIRKARDFAIVLGEFNVRNERVGDVDVRYYYHRDVAPELSLQAAVDSMRTFSEVFGAYPYATFSTVETAFLHGGMEYPALTMISDELEGEIFREVIIHEAAHQWWYAVVGNDQVNHAWIDESLAEFSTTLFFQLNPQYGITYEARMADALSTLTLYAQAFRHQPGFTTSMQRPLSEFRDSLEYTVMVYLKGKIMLDTLRIQIGDEAFFAALRNFYADHKFGIATPQDFIIAFENASNRPLAPFINAWVDGSIQIFGNN